MINEEIIDVRKLHKVYHDWYGSYFIYLRKGDPEGKRLKSATGAKGSGTGFWNAPITEASTRYLEENGYTRLSLDE